MDLLNGYPICKDAVSQFKLTPDSVDVLGLLLRVCYCQGAREPRINQVGSNTAVSVGVSWIPRKYCFIYSITFIVCYCGFIVDSPEIFLYLLLDLKISK